MLQSAADPGVQLQGIETSQSSVPACGKVILIMTKMSDGLCYYKHCNSYCIV